MLSQDIFNEVLEEVDMMPLEEQELIIQILENRYREKRSNMSKNKKRVTKMDDKKIFIMVRRESDQMIIKAYFVPRNLPDGVRFSQVVGDVYEKIYKVYPRKDYEILIGSAYSPRDFLRNFPDWAKGAITFESEEWNYNRGPESEERG